MKKYTSQLSQHHTPYDPMQDYYAPWEDIEEIECEHDWEVKYLLTSQYKVCKICKEESNE